MNYEFKTEREKLTRALSCRVCVSENYHLLGLLVFDVIPLVTLARIQNLILRNSIGVQHICACDVLSSYRCKIAQTKWPVIIRPDEWFPYAW